MIENKECDTIWVCLDFLKHLNCVFHLYKQLLLQPKYTQVIQGSTIEFKIESDERQEVSEVLRLYFHQTE